jgi:arylsulfatase A-like enzyme
MNFRLLLKCLCALFAASSLTVLLAGVAAAKDSRPNILFIMSDDHGYQAISAYGSKVNKTPNLDRIANDGMRFDRCFVTNSICGPSRAVILTGKYSHLNGFVHNGNTFNGEQQTVAKLLQGVGYQTAVVGKWHLKSEPTGFNYWEVLVGQGPYYNPPMKTAEGVVQHTGYTTEIITDLALNWLKTKRDQEKPFFLVYQHKAPHRNWQPEPKYLHKYDDVTIAEPANLFDNYEGRGSAAKSQEMTIERHLNPNDLKLVPPKNLTPEQRQAWDAAYEPKNRDFLQSQLEGQDLIRWKYQRYVKDYLRCVASVDDNVGRVLDYLDESGLAENTVVFYTSDQGWYLGEHGWFDKRWMYEESFRTPLMIRWPGKVKPGSVTNDMAMNLDFAQTFLEIAGAEIPADMQGASLVPVLQEKTPESWRDSVYYHYYEFPGAHAVQRHLGVRTDRYKLIHFYDINEWELFDLEKDPHEMKSVYADPDYADVLKTMNVRLEEMKTQYKDDGSVVSFESTRARNVRSKLARQFAFADGAPQVLNLGDKPPMKHASSPQLDPSERPFTVGAWVKSTNASGVLAAHGGESQGYSFYLDQGVPTLMMRRGGTAATVAAKEAVADGQWTHIAASVDADGVGSILVGGEAVASKKMFLLQSRPVDGLSIGGDTGSRVGNYTDDFVLQADVADIRIYWGKTNQRAWRDWLKSGSSLPK